MALCVLKNHVLAFEVGWKHIELCEFHYKRNLDGTFIVPSENNLTLQDIRIWNKYWFVKDKYILCCGAAFSIKQDVVILKYDMMSGDWEMITVKSPNSDIHYGVRITSLIPTLIARFTSLASVICKEISLYYGQNSLQEQFVIAEHDTLCFNTVVEATPLVKIVSDFVFHSFSQFVHVFELDKDTGNTNVLTVQDIEVEYQYLKQHRDFTYAFTNGPAPGAKNGITFPPASQTTCIFLIQVKLVFQGTRIVINDNDEEVPEEYILPINDIVQKKNPMHFLTLEMLLI